MPKVVDQKDVEALFPEILLIENAKLQSAIVNIWREVGLEMAWDHFEEIPKNVGAEKTESLMRHIRGVTQMAVALGDIAKRLHGRPFDKDLIVAAGLLHDVSKVLEYEPAGPSSGPGTIRPGRKSRLGKNIQHGVYGAHKALAAGLSLELANLIITHTPQSNVRGTTWEAALLFYADFADTDAALSALQAPLFLQRWKLD